MMGSKERHFAPLVNVSLEALVPLDHFYRHLERTLDLSFVREFVQQTYAGGGRPSIDPVVFFKLQLMMFFEGIRSGRQLMRQVADRIIINGMENLPEIGYLHKSTLMVCFPTVAFLVNWVKKETLQFVSLTHLTQRGVGGR
jgi:hypothetical protein